MPGNNWKIVGVDDKPKREEKKEIVPQFHSPPPPPAKMSQKNAERLLYLLAVEHKFDIVKEIVSLYQDAGQLESDLERLKIQKSILKDLMKYCFPVISSEATEKELPGVQINFNLQQGKTGQRAIEGGTIVEAEYTEGEK